MDQPKLESDLSKTQNDGQILSVVNVAQINRPPESKITYPEDNLWYNRLSTWIAASVAVSLICLAIAYFYRRFLFIIPLWPAVAIISWFFKKKFRQIEDGNSSYFK